MQSDQLRRVAIVVPQQPAEPCFALDLRSLEGAFSAGAYEDNTTGAHDLPVDIPIPNWDTDLFRRWSSVGANPDNPSYMSNAYYRAEKWVNMYNPDDVATSFAWKVNNAVENWVPSPLVWPYVYNENELLNPIGEKEYVRIEPPFTVLPPFGTEVPLVAGLTDANGKPGEHAYEILSFLAQSNAMPIGTKSVDWFNQFGENNNKDIRAAWLLAGEANKDSPLFAGTRKNHSFQFHHDAVATWGFWEYIKEETEFDGTY